MGRIDLMNPLRDEDRLPTYDEPWEHEPFEVWANVLWCLRGIKYALGILASRIIGPAACRLDLHEWCHCCSPEYCMHCGRYDPNG
jgi:hypothetical protein